jgi:hypothetical protein
MDFPKQIEQVMVRLMCRLGTRGPRNRPEVVGSVTGLYFSLLFFALLTAGCATSWLVVRVTTQSGVEVTCRLSPDRPGVNMVKLRPHISKAPCTTSEVTTEVISRGITLSPQQTFPTVVYAGGEADIDVPPFPLPAPRSMVLVQVTLKCERGGVMKPGQDTCQIPE